jgi:hypothetical protein
MCGYDPNAIANNFVSHAYIQEKYIVWYDSANRAAFYVDMEESGVIEFKPSAEPSGLYYHDPTDTPGGQQDAVVMVNTVAVTRAKYLNPMRLEKFTEKLAFLHFVNTYELSPRTSFQIVQFNKETSLLRRIYSVPVYHVSRA